VENGKWENRFHHEPVTKIGSARNDTRRKYFIGQQQSITVIKSVPHHHDIFFFPFFFPVLTIVPDSRERIIIGMPSIHSRKRKEIKNKKNVFGRFFLGGGGGQKMEIKFISK
jgi:hypothetical protein